MKGGNFVDYVKLCCRSGKGGAGSVHLYRDKMTASGGPDGGDGGRGGHIILKGNEQLWTLIHLKYKKHVIAGDGKPGGGSRATGADGKDIILEVPLGTIGKDVETGEVEVEITEHGQTVVLTAGGIGGKGNAHFKSATQQTPRYAQPGLPGREEWKVLELKILADVGLVGFPNAGKSTLLSSITAAKPKVADYPFTTLVPNLGIVQYRDDRSFVMADIPGIIENAHLGKGLGHRFLRHIERNALLLFMVPVDSENIRNEYEILVKECEAFNKELLHKDRLLAISKCDMSDEEYRELLKEDLPKDIPIVFISSISNFGLQELKDKIWQLLNKPLD